MKKFFKSTNRLLVYASFIAVSFLCSKKIDYNTRLNTSGSITITPQTTPIVLANYMQNINTAGLLDNTFGSLGSTTTDVTPGEANSSQGIALQPDGKIIVVENGNNGTNSVFALIRYNTNGSPDTSFGSNNNGIVTTNINAGSDSAIFAVALQPDGKIVVAGYGRTGGGTQGFALGRYNSNGSLDSSFNPTGTIPGIVTTPIGGDAQAFAITLQPDGKIVAAGYGTTGGGKQVFALVRYKTNGSPDTSFGSNNNGIVITDVTPGIDLVSVANAVTVQPDGNIVAAGSGSIDDGGIHAIFALVRYKINGSLDISFGQNKNGIVTTDVTPTNANQANGIALQSDGKILLVGVATINVFIFTIARYTPNGILDKNFGTNGGIVEIDVTPGEQSTGLAIVIQPDEKIVAAGNGSNNLFAIVRCNSDGSLDQGFGAGGIVKNAVLNASGAQAVLLQEDGKIVAAGNGTNGEGDLVFAVARYINPFTLASFTASYGSVGLL